jgi:cellulose synthase/poly-beta-1,6-N-acetylglucosamine synthase-like glycosyltransferase/peptidoglycan/xylan/chitin deacetylase (PgdA/CDA1 family)/spore germination protein YaaH
MKVPPQPRRDVPVFYDPQHRRWTHVKGWVLFTGVALSVVLCMLLMSILSNPPLPVLAKLNMPGTALPPSTIAPATYVRPHGLNEPKQTIFRPPLRRPLFPPVKLSRKRPRPPLPMKTMAYVVPWDARSFASFQANAANLDAVIGEWLHVKPSGDLKEEDDQPWRNVLEWRATHQHDALKVFVSVNNFHDGKWDGESLGRRLFSSTERSALAARLAGFAREQKLDGIVVDFEELPDVRMPFVAQLLNELRQLLRGSTIQVAVALPLENDSYPYRRYAGCVDFVVLMAYDQHWSTGDSGPIAAQDWFNEALQKRLGDLPPNRVVVALANYGYDWVRPVNKTDRLPAASLSWWETMRQADATRAAITYHATAFNPFFVYKDAQAREHEVWFLDAVTFFNQLRTVEESQPYGVALWRLGSEDPAVWSFFGQTATGPSIAGALRALPAPASDAVGERPEVLGRTTPPEPGTRAIELNESGKRIAAARYEKVPSFSAGVPVSNDRHKVVLTFDDGPSPMWTPAILDVLKEHQVPAVFFITGALGEEHPELLRRIVDEGHELGSHTFTHPNLNRISSAQLDLELSATQRLLESAVGRRTMLFRPPYGSGDVPREHASSFDPLEALVEQGYLVIGMAIDPRDYKEPGVEELVQRTLKQARDAEGHFILLHDGGGDRSQTLAALPRIIEELKANGFEPVSAATLLGRSPDELMPRLPTRDRIWAAVNRLGFGLLSGLKQALAALFIVGTVLGVARLLLIGLLAVFERWRARRKGFPLGYHPGVAVIVPAYNEEKVILQTIASLLESDGPPFEIIVVDDGSKDLTFFKVMETYGNHPRVKYFKKPNGGKPEALNFGISQTEAEIVVAMDADTVFTRDTIARLTRHFVDPRVGAVAGNAKVGNRVNLLTRWQALEYITSQNLDRRAFSVLNCITVVPGAVGAWRRGLVLQCGGFTGQTLAEDADLTMSIRRLGKRIVNEEYAIALTEAPDTMRGFVRQRYRWMFGTLQAAWKHRGALFRPRYGALGFIALPNIFIFQVLFPLLSPVMDLLTFWSVVGALWSDAGFWSTMANPAAPLSSVLFFYALFVIVDFIAAGLAFALEPDEDWSLLLWLYWQRFCYRQLMYYVAIKSTLAMLRGVEVGWGKQERKGTVKPLPQSSGSAK